MQSVNTPVDFAAAYRLVEKALSLVAEGRAEFMIASHNQQSIEKATKLMYDMGLPPTESGGVFWAAAGHGGPAVLCPRRQWLSG